jgi:hypothetical protein
MIILISTISFSQIENVPVNNQVYEYLHRMGVRGLLPLYSNAMIPLSRRAVAEMIRTLNDQRSELTPAEIEYLNKFRQEFIHEIDRAAENADVLFRNGSLQTFFSDNEKYLYTYTDSSVSLYTEFIGTLEHRRVTGGTYGDTHASFEEHGGRIRGTIKNRVGYYLQATNGTLFGDKTFALSDPRLKSNVKFKDLNSPYFDFTEAYLRADLDWFNLEFGREYSLIGNGYHDRLLLSDNAPVFDFFKLDFHYKSLRFVFMQGSIIDDSSNVSELNKYLALHRVQFSLFDMMNIGFSEMIIYRRYSPDFAYLNPINFYKSAEHSLRDRDNAFLNFDLEFFPVRNYKFYGTWLIDDIDFKKMGTGWWGNEFGWQGGMYITEIGTLPNLDAAIEYTRIEPYVYSNRLAGNDYTHNNFGLGSHLEPNSDEWYFELSYRPMKQLRTWLNYSAIRHGANYEKDGEVVNVGGDALLGHRFTDSETAHFLSGGRVRTDRVQVKAVYELVTNYFFTGTYEIRQTHYIADAQSMLDHYFLLSFHIEY